MNARNDAQSGVREATRARAELYDTLGQLRDQLNYAQRIDDAVDRAKARAAREREERPFVFVAKVASVAVVAGAVVWGVARTVARRFD